MLQLSQVSKRYGECEVLAPTDLQVPGGQTRVLIGPSGCGKSTLLRLIAGLIQPDSGSISFEGIQLEPGNVLQLRQRMGYVIQEGGLFPHLNVRDNVTVMARYLRRQPDWIEARLAELAELVQLPTDLMQRFPAELSGGQRQRVSLMRALMLDPDLLLLDDLVLMREGRIVQTGSISQLAGTPAEPFVEAFISAQRKPMAQLAEALK